MTFEKLREEYNKLQNKYGDKSLDSIISGGLKTNPDICFVFMNPTGRNIASSKEWKGLKSPWVGTKNVWDLFESIGVIDKEIYLKIKNIKGKEWTPSFAEEVYQNVIEHKTYITNLAKCTQIDARPLRDTIYKKYLDLFFKEIELVNPKVIILFGKSSIKYSIK